MEAVSGQTPANPWRSPSRLKVCDSYSPRADLLILQNRERKRLKNRLFRQSSGASPAKSIPRNKASKKLLSSRSSTSVKKETKQKPAPTTQPTKHAVGGLKGFHPSELFEQPAFYARESMGSSEPGVGLNPMEFSEIVLQQSPKQP